MKTRIAVIIPVVIVVLAVGAIFFAEWRSGRLDHKWDYHGYIESFADQEDGSVLVTAFSNFYYGESTETIYKEFLLPEKIARKVNLYDSAIFWCDYKEKDGQNVVTRLHRKPFNY